MGDQMNRAGLEMAYCIICILQALVSRACRILGNIQSTGLYWTEQKVICSTETVMNKQQLKQLEKQLWADKGKNLAETAHPEYQNIHKGKINEDLPEGYDRELFQQKCSTMYDLVFEFLANEQRWAA